MSPSSAAFIGGVHVGRGCRRVPSRCCLLSTTWLRACSPTSALAEALGPAFPRRHGGGGGGGLAAAGGLPPGGGGGLAVALRPITAEGGIVTT